MIVYLNNILIYFKNKQQYKEHIYKVLMKLQEVNLLINPKKSNFHIKEVEFLKYIIQPGKITIEPAKVAIIKE